MKWSLHELKSMAEEPIVLLQTIDLEDNLKQRDEEILAAHPVKLEGVLLYEYDSILVQCQITTALQLPSTRSLEPVWVDIACPLNERYLLTRADEFVDEKETLHLSLEGDELDLRPAIVDQIILNKPVQRLSPKEARTNELPAGDDWQVLTEEMWEQEQADVEEQIDPRMAKLKTLLIQDDEDEE